MSDTRMDKTLANLVEEMDNVTTHAIHTTGLRSIRDSILDAGLPMDGYVDDFTTLLDRDQGKTGKRWLLIEID